VVTVDSAPVPLHRVDVGSFVYVSKVQSASIFRVYDEDGCTSETSTPTYKSVLYVCYRLTEVDKSSNRTVTDKHDHDSSGTLNQVWPRWRGSAAVYPIRQTEVDKAVA
jgi:hypothetical protein